MNNTTTTTITFMTYDIIVSATGRVYLTNEGSSLVIQGPFASVEEAKAEIEDMWIAYQDIESTCPICDAFGCGADGGGCYKYEGRGEIADPRDYVDAF